jgi:hypothetical protein
LGDLFTNNEEILLNLNVLYRKRIITFLISFFYLLFFSNLKNYANENEKNEAKQDNAFIKKVSIALNGFTVGTDTRVFPYAALEDWFDPYGGVKLEHQAFPNSADRMFHHFKFEGPRDYSWKFRYLANSISTHDTKFSFLFKRKIDRDPFFYGIGNSTFKSQRAPAKYASIFFGAEVEQNISNNVVFRFSPGFWKFTSGLRGGREFEKASNAQYVSARFTLGDRKSIDYWNASWDNQWSAYVEIGLPVNSSVANYIRFNLETMTRFPLFKNTKLGIATRFEYLISTNRDLVPYFAMPEAGSRSGLRGFSKQRFVNFSLNVINFEYSFPLTKDFDGFLLSDIAQTASNPTKLLSKQIHAGFGFGFRLRNVQHPISFGVAASHESLKLFSAIAIGSPW